MSKRILAFVLTIFILTDVSYSFVQNLQIPLEGDMAEAIIPANGYEKIFKDPFAISVITENAIYPNPNRYFLQWSYAKYFQHMPFLLQKFVYPIESIYLCSAIAKILIQISIILLSAFYITGKRKILSLEFLIAAALIIPLFQTNGYRSYMGIIDPSATYTFSYAMPCALLLLFYLPFFEVNFYNKQIITNKIFLLLLFLFTFVISFNGPLIPGASLVISLLYFVYHFKQDGISFFKKIPGMHLFFFSLLSILSLYSLYVGGNNSQFINDKIPIIQRYLRLPEGLYLLLTQKIGYPLLLIFISINAYLINKKHKTEEGRKILNLLKWIGLFSLLYIILLPLGGYRSYRPNIIRYDSIMPITISLIVFYGLSSFFLLKQLTNRKIYLMATIGFSLIFTFADKPEFGKNCCEKSALEKLATSTQSPVLIENDCTVMAWKKINEPRSSALNAQLLQYWGITKERILYYQK